MEKINENREFLNSALVGLVDIVASTKISNQVDVYTEWELKKHFFEIAHATARETGMQILVSTGDGFLFYCDPSKNKNWAENFFSFHRELVTQFNVFLSTLGEAIQGVETGLKMGASMGPLLITKSLPSNTVQVIAVGPDINLAARLCSTAKIGEMVISSRFWECLRHLELTINARKIKHEPFKGFENAMVAFHATVCETEDHNETKSTDLIEGSIFRPKIPIRIENEKAQGLRTLYHSMRNRYSPGQYQSGQTTNTKGKHLASTTRSSPAFSQHRKAYGLHCSRSEIIVESDLPDPPKSLRNQFGEV